MWGQSACKPFVFAGPTCNILDPRAMSDIVRLTGGLVYMPQRVQVWKSGELPLLFSRRRL